MSGAPDMGHGYSAYWNTPREIAEKKVEQLVICEMLDQDQNDTTAIRAESAVDIVLSVLTEPDRDMVAAGVGALDQAMMRKRPIEQRELVTLIWQAMLKEARR